MNHMVLSIIQFSKLVTICSIEFSCKGIDRNSLLCNVMYSLYYESIIGVENNCNIVKQNKYLRKLA